MFLCDIGNGTMNLLKISDRKPDMLNMFTEKYGVYQCTLAVREAMMREHHTNLDESTVIRLTRRALLVSLCIGFIISNI
ncbi:hypothetical protein [Ruminococcus sp. JL13D9]|uniref:hypothetical protein n=1 Tax=Ruminococcus sp. JL13D9 TaxID=3233381 RepID=UPI00389A9E02